MANKLHKFFYTYNGPNGEAPSEEILNSYNGFVFDETNRVMYANGIPYNYDDSELKGKIEELEKKEDKDECLTKEEADELYEPKKPVNLISKEDGLITGVSEDNPSAIGKITVPLKKGDNITIHIDSFKNTTGTSDFNFTYTSLGLAKNYGSNFDIEYVNVSNETKSVTIIVSEDFDSYILYVLDRLWTGYLHKVTVVKGDKPYTWEEIYGSDGTGSYDDTELKKWVSDTYIPKGTDANKLIQDNGGKRDIYDSENLDNAGVGTQIPTVRSIKNALASYAKTNDLSSLVSSEDLVNKLTNLKSEILGGAGEDYDTLKEIEKWIEEHQDIYQALVATVSQKSTKDELKTVEINVLNELGKKSNVVVCDNQYEFDNILTKDNNTIYLIKGDQDVWAAKEYVDELYDLMVSLRDRIKRVEVVMGIDDIVTGEDGNGGEDTDDDSSTAEDTNNVGRPVVSRD